MALCMSVSECTLNKSRFSRMVQPLKRVGDCGITDMFFRTLCKPTLAISTPSMKIVPCSASSNRKRVCTMVLFPLPVRPTMPTLDPGGMANVAPSRARGKPARYRTDKSFTSTAPPLIHPFSKMSLSEANSNSASGCRLANSNTRSTAIILFTTSADSRTIYGKFCVDICTRSDNARPSTAGSIENQPCVANSMDRSVAEDISMKDKQSKVVANHREAEEKVCVARLCASNATSIFWIRYGTESLARIVATPLNVSLSMAKIGDRAKLSKRLSSRVVCKKIRLRRKNP
mmetsp:Transcript_45426/g.53191  ORF Transcript_45426/g.53191 Transcript_45426/m.53191 type:complete len:288 (+) Transcript_45426:449-1312(+)